jgi:urease accessory protein
MSSDPVIGIKVEQPVPRLLGGNDPDDLTALRNPEAAWGQAAPPSDASADATWFCGLLQAGDSFFPTGSYAHSFGLEGLVQEGVVHDAATLKAYLFQAALPALRHTELPLAAHAWRALSGPDWASLRELSALSSALRTPREARVASENIGRQRAELAARLRPSPLAAEFLARARAEGWPFSAPVAAALEGRVLGAPLTAVLAGVTYAGVASLLSAAMKLLRLGQNGAQTLLTEALAAAPALIAAAEGTPRDEIGWFNPWLDIASARHETADARMFIS